jgi:hypothetical protein
MKRLVKVASVAIAVVISGMSARVSLGNSLSERDNALLKQIQDANEYVKSHESPVVDHSAETPEQFVRRVTPQLNPTQNAPQTGSDNSLPPGDREGNREYYRTHGH